MKLPEPLHSLIEGKYGEKFRFLLAGGFNTAAGYSLFALGLLVLTPVLTPLAAFAPAGGGATFVSHLATVLNWIGEHPYLVIQWIMWALSVPIGAFTLKYFAFRAQGPFVKQALRSYVVYLPAQMVASACLFFFATLLGFPVLVAQLFSVAIATIISFLGHKYFTFKQSPADGA
ncbi:MAG: GtrA family protein [Coriobacteriia bacterium]|nr:GtrA family protein [Coriobacteriia bacterium]MCL2536883.1 GtrA family protein [Coriobacteriia bacterium]